MRKRTEHSYFHITRPSFREIYTFGKQPWYELGNHEVISEVTDGKLLEKPDNCCEEIFEIMLSCWQQRPQDRTPMRVLHERLKALADKESGDYMDCVEEDEPALPPQ